MPTVNQVELHPRFHQAELRAWHARARDRHRGLEPARAGRGCWARRRSSRSPSATGDPGAGDHPLAPAARQRRHPQIGRPRSGSARTSRSSTSSSSDDGDGRLRGARHRPPLRPRPGDLRLALDADAVDRRAMRKRGVPRLVGGRSARLRRRGPMPTRTRPGDCGCVNAVAATAFSDRRLAVRGRRGAGAGRVPAAPTAPSIWSAASSSAAAATPASCRRSTARGTSAPTGSSLPAQVALVGARAAAHRVAERRRPLRRHARLRDQHRRLVHRGPRRRAENRLVWSPDVVGCALFLISGHLAMVEMGGWLRRPRDLGWGIVVVNQVGSILFMVSAVASFVRPSTGDELAVGIANWGTLTGALCFAIAGVMQEFERPLSARRRTAAFGVADPVAALAVHAGLVDDHRPEQDVGDRDRDERRDLGGDRDQDQEDDREQQPLAVDRPDVAVAEGDVAEQVEGDPAEQGEGRDRRRGGRRSGRSSSSARGRRARSRRPSSGARRSRSRAPSRSGRGPARRRSGGGRRRSRRCRSRSTTSPRRGRRRGPRRWRSRG